MVTPGDQASLSADPSRKSSKFRPIERGPKLVCGGFFSYPSQLMTRAEYELVLLKVGFFSNNTKGQGARAGEGAILYRVLFYIEHT
jgi:hypothetical protein